MSKEICVAAIDGAVQWVAQAEKMLDSALKEHGPEQPVGFPDTAYYLPVTYALTGLKTGTLGDVRTLLNRSKSLLPARPADECWLPYLGNALDAGIAALLACEAIEAMKYTVGPKPVDGIWLGAASDVIMRERGVEFVDGTAPGFAAITGAAPSNEIAVKIARELQEKNIYVFMGGPHQGRQFAEQLAEEGVQLGWETRLVPFGKDVSALIYALGFASRAAMAFGGVKPGQGRDNLLYNKNRVFAFVLALGDVTPDKYSIAAGAINYGFPVISDTDIPEILPTGVTTYEHVVANVPHEKMVERALEVRGCKIKITKVPVPVACSAAFEGELIRKKDVHVEFGGNKTQAFEFVSTVGMDEIDDHTIELIGPDVDEVAEGTALPLGIWVEVAGRKMQTDFEPILERQIHHFLNNAEGVWHMGQRDIVWTRISKKAFANGFRLKHYGEILHARFLSDYPAIVDKVRVTLITDADEVARRIDHARQVYDQRNRRLEAMTDESVETFYSCLLCQSFAPTHVCVISPERAGLCGAYNWLDGKAAYEIDETGPNQPVQKGACLDPVMGVFQGVNDYVRQNSQKAIERITMYSIMDAPMTSCGCFEVICAYVPELNGIMAVSREYGGETPVGMKFSSLAGNVGGGMQTPGFFGCGKVYLTSRKFLFAEGGMKRLVWIPKVLKEQIGEDLKRRGAEQGFEDILEKIADESHGIEASEVRTHLEQVGHPALQMESIEELAAAAPVAEAAVAETSNVETAVAEPVAAEQTVESAAAVAEGMLNLDVAALKAEVIQSVTTEIRSEIQNELRETMAREIVGEIISTLKQKFLGEAPDQPQEQSSAPEPAPVVEVVEPQGPSAAERIADIKDIPVRKEPAETPLHTVTLGGGRRKSVTIGGASAMPFHHYEGAMPHPPVICMEVFDKVSEKYPEPLRQAYGALLTDPAAMAAECVARYGADLISVRLDGTHPERGARTPEQALEVVQNVLKAVDVPLLITGQGHFESSNEVIKLIAKECADENLLLNWVEQDNYRTVAGAALAYGHSLAAMSPIDVNIAKQLNILLTNMDMPLERILIDPTTGALGYGIEYTYSVMERIRLTGLGGDKFLASPMIVSPGPECMKIKEVKAPEADFPAWGDLSERAAIWELSTATSLLYAGADVLIMHHPEAAMELKRTIQGLMG